MNPEDESGQNESSIVFVVDDDPAVRKSLRNLIRSIGLRVETFASAAAFLQEIPPTEPACLVLDVGLPGKSGIDLQRELTAKSHPLPIIFITGRGDVPTSVRAMKAGAAEFLTKPFSEADLIGAIHLAIEGNRLALGQRAESARLRERYETLTPREREVLKLVVQGLMNKEVAAELGTSEITVKIQRRRAMRKMQAQSLAALVRFAERLEREK